MKVQDTMTSEVTSVQSTESIANAAQTMADYDLGALPVLEGRNLVGIVTDRDIAVRAVAEGIDAESPVRLVMTEEVTTCSPETELEEALGIMGSKQIRRLPICDDSGQLIGIVTLADAANNDPDKCEVGEALDDISDRGGLHCQAPVI